MDLKGLSDMKQHFLQPLSIKSLSGRFSICGNLLRTLVRKSMSAVKCNSHNIFLQMVFIIKAKVLPIFILFEDKLEVPNQITRIELFSIETKEFKI